MPGCRVQFSPDEQQARLISENKRLLTELKEPQSVGGSNIIGKFTSTQNTWDIIDQIVSTNYNYYLRYIITFTPSSGKRAYAQLAFVYNSTSSYDKVISQYYSYGTQDYKTRWSLDIYMYGDFSTFPINVYVKMKVISTSEGTLSWQKV